MGGNSSVPIENDDTVPIDLYNPSFTPTGNERYPEKEVWAYYYNYCMKNYDILKNNPAFGGIKGGDEFPEIQWCGEWGTYMEELDKPNQVTRLRPVNAGCVKEVWNWLISSILHVLNPKKYPDLPEKPGVVCSTIGIMALLVLGMAMLAVLYFFGSAVGIARWVWDALTGTVKGSILYSSTFVLRMGTAIIEEEGPFVNAVKYLVDVFFDLINFIIRQTEVAPGLLYLNVATLAALLITMVVKDAECLEERFKGTIYADIFRVVDWPFEFILKLVQDFAGGKGLFYYIAKFFVLPFQGGALMLSLILGSIGFVFEELLAVIRERMEEEPTPPVITKENYSKRVKQ
jgi:hypothetical protein